MQKVFTNQNIAIVGVIRSYLEENGINSQMRNEFSSSVMGDLSFLEVWPELWVAEGQVEKAKQIVSKVRSNDSLGPDWVCQQCKESNPSNFEVCWHCEQAP